MGWNKPTGAAPTAPKKKPNVFRGLIAGLVVVALAAIAYFTFLGGNATAPEAKAEKKPAAIKEVKPAAAPNADLKLGPTNLAVASKVVVEPPGDRVVSVRTNKSGYIIEELVAPDGSRMRHIREPKSLWKNATDSLIATALAASPDAELPPWPNMGPDMDKEFLRNVKTPIEYLPTDSEEDVALKKIVAATRDDLAERVRNGEHLCDILAEHRNLANDNSKIRSDVKKEVSRLVKSGATQAEVSHYLTIMNAALQQMNIKPVGEDKPSSEAHHRKGKARPKNTKE